MTKKILQSTAIVPTELYVERNADRQVYKVIEEMGRPGYVLVARQMGKTNLLLNAKRKLEGNDDIFVYIDLSNSFDTSRQRFRSFIDTALEIDDNNLGKVADDIYKDRTKHDLPAHIEHTRELKKILRSIRGKLVIILDEVDSLTKSDYSDEIFAQIRSIYFSRVNFPEANRLTYLLSGVAEPTELIKNPKISPFNIGEKIYLDDFSREEFKTFIKLSKLSITEQVYERIYYWTNGNPRITWDVCSEIEDLIMSGIEVTFVDVDGVINKLYLTNYDRPPIDHIRILIEKERELRNAITEIRYGKGSSVPDSIKSKLYLSGIINVNTDNRQIVIKNKIIDLSLSKEYLEDLETTGKKIISIAYDMFINSNYKDAIKYYKLCLDDNNTYEISRDDIISNIGHCYFNLLEYASAIEYFTRIDLNRKRKSEIYFSINYYLGMSYLYLENAKSAIDCFTNVVNGQMYDWYYFSSLNALGSSYLRLNKDDVETAEELFLRTLRELNEHSLEIGPTHHSGFMMATNFNLASVYYKKGNFILAEQHSISAINLVENENKLKIYALLLKICSKNTEKYLTYSSYVNSIIDNDVTAKMISNSYGLEFDIESLMTLSLFSFINNDLTLHDKTIDIYKRSINREFITAEFYYALANYSLSLDMNDDAIKIFKYILTDILFNVEYNYFHYIVSKSLLIFGNGEFDVGNVKVNDIYVNSLKNYASFNDCDLNDLHILAHIFYVFLSKKTDNLDTIIKLAENIIIASNGKFNSNYSWIYFSKMIMNRNNGLLNDELLYAQKYIEIYDKKIISDLSNSVLKKDDLDQIADKAYNIIKAYKNSTSSDLNFKKYGRNDIISVQYIKGLTVKNKYKRLEKDLYLGKCFIVENK